MRAARFRKGDHVRFQWGTTSVQGVVREDRGPIGVKGRHLYLVEFCVDPDADSPAEIELPAVDMELVEHPVSTN